mgnify:CR=1 FL=1
MDTVDNRTFKEKVHDFTARLKLKWEDFKKFCSENKEAVLAVLLVLIPAISKMASSGAKAYAEHKEDRRRQTDYYDPRTGEHWYTKKPLTANQKLNLEQRYNSGESKGAILKDMGLL